MVIQSEPSPQRAGVGRSHRFGADAAVQYRDARAVDAAGGKHVGKRPVRRHDVRRVAKRPAIDVIVGTHFRVGLGVAVMERHPGVVPPQAAQRHQAMGFDVVGLDDVRPASVNEPTEIIDEPRVVPMALDQDVNRNTIGGGLRVESIRRGHVAETAANQRERNTHVNAADSKPSYSCVVERVASDTGQPGGLEKGEHIETRHCLQGCGEAGRGMHAARGCNEAANR